MHVLNTRACIRYLWRGRNAGIQVFARLFADTGRDSPPEPAPPEVPPRGPSLHATHTLRTQQNRNGCPPNATGNFAVPTDQMQTEKYSGKCIIVCCVSCLDRVSKFSLRNIQPIFQRHSNLRLGFLL